MDSSSAAKIVVYTTTDDEREARVVAERLWYEQRRKASVESVNFMAAWADPRLVNPAALHTSNRYAVIAEAR
jgi:hypothetical protein